MPAYSFGCLRCLIIPQNGGLEGFSTPSTLSLTGAVGNKLGEVDGYYRVRRRESRYAFFKSLSGFIGIRTVVIDDNTWNG